MVCIECHREHGNKEICKGQRHQKVVVDVSELSVEDDAKDDQAVVYDRHKDDEDQSEALQE